MPIYSELEIHIQKDSQDQFMVSTRHRLDAGAIITSPVLFDFDPNNRAFFSGDPAVCGQALSAALFAPVGVRDALVAAQARSQATGVQLRVRLQIDPALSALHSLRWETLADPRDNSSLVCAGRSIFSRYLFTQGQYLPMLRPQTNIKALVVIANPTDLEGQAAIDVNAEAGTAINAMSNIEKTFLRSGGSATLAALLSGLKAGPDILYLVCHGVLEHGVPKLLLENPDGSGDVVDGQHLADQIKPDNTPSLVVLCSCQSAGTAQRGSDVMTSLGPLLANAGVPAVLAMQGNISMDSMDLFMPRFFEELAEHGEVDRAAAAARSFIANQPDWWMPVVFTRLDSARIWYSPGFGKPQDGVDPWARIVRNIGARTCTPVLGASVAEKLLGTRRDLARSWGETFRYPMSGRDTEDLPQIAQYLSVSQEGSFPRREFYKYVYLHLLREHRPLVPAHFLHLDEDDVLAQLGELVSTVGRALRAADESEPHRVLAGYKLPVYVTTDPSNLLVDALKEQTEQGKPVVPRVRLLQWNAASRALDEEYVSQSALEAGARPTKENPIVVKLFGDLADPGTLVMTEDQYFDYLTAVAATKDVIPPSVRYRLTDSALLFVGFQAEAWEFRVLFRSLLKLEGQDLRRDYEHFSVQIDPNSILDPGSARRYIEQYLQSKAKLKLYWGDVATFIAELKRRTQ
ncbi:MAG: CHAT domain-containing protein [Pseudomonadota bacterium]